MKHFQLEVTNHKTELLQFVLVLFKVWFNPLVAELRSFQCLLLLNISFLWSQDTKYLKYLLNNSSEFLGTDLPSLLSTNMHRKLKRKKGRNLLYPSDPPLSRGTQLHEQQQYHSQWVPNKSTGSLEIAIYKYEFSSRNIHLQQ